ncbi:MAG: right-handed parallel beta-helix repeat-containing protein, partial [Thermoplasmata archaeon]|nr:right-handed parallel beta-helix repeat-containing protein [Thermoplasmata archaeon]
SNVVANNTAINNTNTGIILYSFNNNNIVVNNIVTGNSHQGICLHLSTSNTIESNTIEDNILRGILDYECWPHNRYFNNTCSNNGEGICIEGSNSFSCSGYLYNNTCNGNSGNGIYVGYMHQLAKVENNTCNDNQVGIKFHHFGQEPVICKNTCVGNTEVGIVVPAMASVSNNTLSFSKYGLIDNSASGGYTIEDNSFFGNEHGCFVCEVSSIPDDNWIHPIIIENNTFLENIHGLSIHYRDSSLIDEAIQNVYRNHFERNIYGMIANHEANVTISRNNVFVENHLGFWGNDSLAKLDNNTFQSNTYGLFWEGGDGGVIANNSFVSHMCTSVEVVDAYPFNMSLYRYNGTGAYLYLSNVSVRDNSFTDSVFGLVLDRSGSVVSGNVFSQFAAEYYPYVPWEPPVMPGLPGDWSGPGGGVVRPPPGGGVSWWIYDEGITVLGSNGTVLADNYIWGNWNGVVVGNSTNISIVDGDVLGTGYFHSPVPPSGPQKWANYGLHISNASMEIRGCNLSGWPVAVYLCDGACVSLSDSVFLGEGIPDNMEFLCAYDSQANVWNNSFGYRNNALLFNSILDMHHNSYLATNHAIITASDSTLNFTDHIGFDGTIDIYGHSANGRVSNNTMSPSCEAIKITNEANLLIDNNTIQYSNKAIIITQATATITHNTIENCTQGVYICEGNATIIHNTIIYSGTGIYIEHQWPGYFDRPLVRNNNLDLNDWSIHLLGTDTLDGHDLYTNNTIGTNNNIGAIWQEWNLRIIVKEPDGTPIDYADVWINGTTGLVWAGKTNRYGATSYIPTTEYIVGNEGTKTFWTPHSITIKKDGLYQANEYPVLMDINKDVVFPAEDMMIFVEGINHISLPCYLGELFAADLAALIEEDTGANVSHISYCAGSGWIDWTPGWPTENFALENSTSYAITLENLPGPAYWLPRGTPFTAPLEISVSVGWSTVAIPYTEGGTINASDIMTQNPDICGVADWDETTQTWKFYYGTGEEDIIIQESAFGFTYQLDWNANGIAIQCNQPTTWTPT